MKHLLDKMGPISYFRKIQKRELFKNSDLQIAVNSGLFCPYLKDGRGHLAIEGLSPNIKVGCAGWG